MIKKGIKYSHSLMHNDCHPYNVRVKDRWNKINYSQHPDTRMKPLVRGEETDLVEIPANWYLDDLPPHMFIVRHLPSFALLRSRVPAEASFS